MPEGLRDVDANLLLSLHALLEERNLTHAGARMTMSQSAMSGALARLRKHFNDELLTRTGREYELTPFATRLRPAVAAAVEAAESLLGNHREFDPATSGKRFDVSMSEYAMTVLAEPLIRLLREQAPGCSMNFDSVPESREQFEVQLLRRDLVVVPLGFDLPGRTQAVFTDELACVVARSNPRLKDGALTLEDLREMPHAVAEFLSAGEHRRPLEVELEAKGLAARTVLVQVTSLLTLPFAVAGTGMCAFVPARMAHRCLDMLDLVIAETPLDTVSITEAAHWHPRHAADPAGVWLRHLLHDVAVDIL
ncbi:LysR family transcriptional regulator [Paractinoplanes atraurantiacus]|uniref:DNA-binding transcriptional regulator, LysR family n=1 Tax=Paractinoplanes atraurantiacus TaxID=1036182 RepID=A0A285JYY0_9ACTN|nr:LysR family transcriptional regulator [Actinoplanes atraurantiacus]SNY65500.1 DNA-binding transcriptional regulator, LysR family [Actinoplanes atraurantiacus]